MGLEGRHYGSWAVLRTDANDGASLQSGYGVSVLVLNLGSLDWDHADWISRWKESGS